MDKRPFLATLLLGGLCAAFILAMFSQTQEVNGRGHYATGRDNAGSSRFTLDPGRPDRVDEILQRMIEASTKIEPASARDDANEPRPRRLKLR